MSSDSLAMTRQHAGSELAKLAEEHFKHDLKDSDRDLLNRAARKLSTHATLGSLTDLGIGLFLAYRFRKMRMEYFNAFKAAEKPVAVKFASGREEPVPDITPLIKPSRWGDVAAYFFFPVGGLFVFGELGLLTGSWSARRTITRNPESRARIEKAFRAFRADVLRREAERLEKGERVGMGDLRTRLW